MLPARSATVLITFCTLGLTSAHLTKEEVLKNGRLDVALKSKNHHYDPVGQGPCPEGWKDGSSVGLGCVLADLRDVNIDEVTAENICKDFGEGGRLVEIFKLV